MTTRPGRITAHLAETADDQISPDLIELINQNIHPPTPLDQADIHVRVMYIASDQVNSFGGRFPAAELEHLAELLIDSPVLVGHRKDQLPIARTFHAAPVQRNSQSWVKSYFFWLKSADGAESLKENIDGGIYKECSIGFTFSFPKCSACGDDIRSCPHTPLQTYPETGGLPCYFDYCQIEKVLETSLVYRGATPDTSVGSDLMLTKDLPIIPTADLPEYTLCIDSAAGAACFRLTTRTSHSYFELRQFNLNRFLAGCRFIADRIPDSKPDRSSNRETVLMSGVATRAQITPDSYRLHLPDHNRRPLIIRPIRHRGEDRFLFYLSRSSGEGPHS